MYLLIYVLDFSNTDGKWFLLIASFDVVGPSDGLWALGQTRQAVDGVCGHSDDVTLLQSFHGAAQDFSNIYTTETRSGKHAVTTAAHDTVKLTVKTIVYAVW